MPKKTNKKSWKMIVLISAIVCAVILSAHFYLENKIYTDDEFKVRTSAMYTPEEYLEKCKKTEIVRRCSLWASSVWYGAMNKKFAVKIFKVGCKRGDQVSCDRLTTINSK